MPRRQAAPGPVHLTAQAKPPARRCPLPTGLNVLPWKENNLAQAMAEFIPHHHGCDAINATVLRELLRGNHEVKARDLWMTWWVDKPESEAQRVLRKLEAKRLGR